MDRYVGLDAHAKTCTLAVMSRSGKRLRSMVVETNGHALVEAVKGITGDVHLCLEEGTQSAWLHELLSPHTHELVVSVPEKKRGPKDDLCDAWSRADDMRVGRVQTRVYKAPKHLAGMRSAACAYRLATGDVVRTKNRLKAVFRSRGIRSDSGVYEAASRDRWLRQLPSGPRDLASWIGQELDGLVPQRDEAEEWLRKEAKSHPIIRKLRTAPGMGPIRTAQLVAIVGTPHRFRTRRQFWSYCGLAVVTRSSSDWVESRDGGWVRGQSYQTRGLSRPDEASGRDRQGVGARAGDASVAQCRFGVARRERFEGKHPRISWSSGRDGETPPAGYVPSEHRMKRWPHEAQSGGWCPPRRGSERSARFCLGRDLRYETASGPLRSFAPAGLVAWTGISLDERSGLSQQSPVAIAAADEQEEYSLDTSFLRS